MSGTATGDRSIAGRRERLREYLARHWSDPGLAIREFRELSDGWSRITYALTVERGGASLPLIVQVERDHGLVIGSRVARDYATLRALEGTTVPAPRAHLLCDDLAVLDGAFLVVDRMEGTCRDMFSRKDRAALEAHWESRSGLPESVVEVIAAIHGVPAERFPFLPAAPSAAAAAGWEIARCREIAAQIGRDRDPFVAAALRWLERNRPARGALGLVHGDYHLRNLLLSGERVTGVLDWELTRISDPLFDIAYMCIPYLSGKFFSPGSPYALGLVPHDHLVRDYGRRCGQEIDAATFRFWRVLATLSLLLIICTGVSAFEAGIVRDMRSAWLRFVEPVLQEDLLCLLGETARIKT